MKRAFTLAEVLITLSIIGVVAALTMPTLIAKYQKHVWYNQFMKAASVLENAVKMYEVDNGCEGDILDCTTYDETLTSSAFTNAFAPYFNIISNIDETNINDYSEYITHLNDIGNNWECIGSPCAFITNDGMLFNMFTDEYAGGGGFVDINGPRKGPNQNGKDLFFYYVPGVAQVSDDGSFNKNILWSGNWDSAGCPDDGAYGCATKLLKEGKMNY